MRISAIFAQPQRAARVVRGFAAGSALLAGLAASGNAQARPGTHPLVVSTWDARASSVVLGYRHGMFSGGGLDVVSYHANFSSTTGTLSSQFGLYYLTLSEPNAPTTHGAAGSATAIFNFPVARRFDNGLPLAAIDLYVGSAPTALVSGERNYLSIPLVLGFGVPVTPVKALSITPWFELAPSFNLDTVVHPFEFSAQDASQYIDPSSGKIKLTSDAVERVVSESVTLDTSGAVGARGGLDFSVHISDYVDLSAGATLSSLGSAFSGTSVVYLGGGFIWRWDDIVPAVLPAEKRLLHESCEDVELRFRSCPAARGWRTPEQLQQLNTPPAPPVAPPPQRVPAGPAPMPAAPASAASLPAAAESSPAQNAPAPLPPPAAPETDASSAPLPPRESAPAPAP